MIYRKGDREQPYLNPLELWKKLQGLPFIKGAIQGPTVQACISSTNSFEKPKVFNTTTRKDRFTLSKAFVMSIFRMKPFSLLERLVWMASWTRMMLSTICLLGTNPPWFSEIIEGRRGFSLPAMILEIILYELLQRDMGLKRLREEGQGSLGIRAKKFELVYPPIFLFLITYFIIFSISSLIRSQKVLWKAMGKLSGPGTNSGCKA